MKKSSCLLAFGLAFLTVCFLNTSASENDLASNHCTEGEIFFNSPMNDGEIRLLNSSEDGEIRLANHVGNGEIPFI